MAMRCASFRIEGGSVPTGGVYAYDRDSNSVGVGDRGKWVFRLAQPQSVVGSWTEDFNRASVRELSEYLSWALGKRSV